MAVRAADKGKRDGARLLIAGARLIEGSALANLGDLSREAWSLLPGQGDFVAEMRTRRYDTLTYARSGAEAEDITLFDRKRHHNIALYASKQKLATRGRFYNEDDLVDYDVLHYDIDVAASPDRQWIDGKTTLRIKVRSYVLGTLTLRLADPLVVQSIVSYEYGRLFGIRVKNQNTLVVNLPTALTRDTEITLTIADTIPRGHKVALRAIRAGERVIKYGSPIGLASSDIAPGAHVHIHNVASTRGRGDLRSAAVSREE